MDVQPEQDSVLAKLLRLGRRPLPVTRRQVLIILGGAAALGGAGIFLNTHHGAHFRQSVNLRLWIPTSFDGDAEITRCRVAADAIRPLFPRKGAPGWGDWLTYYDEPGQTFNQYLREMTPATREVAGAILVLPYGDFDPRLVQIVADAVELTRLFYGRSVQLLPGESLPPLGANQRSGRGASEQLYVHPLLEMLKRRVPVDAAALLAMTPTDLTPGEGWNFVFGMASLVDRVGVWSLYRLAAPKTPPALQLRRIAGVALHELGHMFGIWHCRAYECCMNGANTMRETDAAPLAFCPECDAKVCWRFRLDPGPRYVRLAEYAKALGLERDAELWWKCADAVGNNP